jgi:hypothetical protein
MPSADKPIDDPAPRDVHIDDVRRCIPDLNRSFAEGLRAARAAGLRAAHAGADYESVYRACRAALADVQAEVERRLHALLRRPPE